MVRQGLLALSLALFFNLQHPVIANPPAEEDAFKTTLALQQSMQTARHHLLAGDSKKAVEVLEEQLPRVNGNATFLRILREAYRTYIKELWLANNSTSAKLYLERLCILEPTAAKDATLRPPETSTKILPEPKSGPLNLLPAKFFPNFALNNPLKRDVKPPTVRAKIEDNVRENDPFAPANMLSGAGAGVPSIDPRQLLSKAEEEFARRHYAEAGALFRQAFQADQNCVNNCREPWAYCILSDVAEQLNQPPQKRAPAAELEQQVRGAVAMAPNLDQTGQMLLREIGQRSNAPAVTESTNRAGVQHLGRNKEGWQVTETAFFRIFHNQNRDQIEKIAAIAETTRREMYRKWFGNETSEWTPKCELILHPTGTDYSRMTGVPATSPGHTRIEREQGSPRVISRRMDLHCDVPTMMEAVLPHETTHAVLAGMFGNFDVPRWADEGIAVLTEPDYKIDQHRRNLEKARHEGSLFGVLELMKSHDYPQPHRVGAFYAQSVCLVEFMASLRGPQVFTAFVKDGLREGYESALRRHYSMEINELQQRWEQQLAGGNRVAAGP